VTLDANDDEEISLCKFASPVFYHDENVSKIKKNTKGISVANMHGKEQTANRNTRHIDLASQATTDVPHLHLSTLYPSRILLPC
jgi:glucosamine 6-phosphate synthetase-like amidotransferase/phosphosugar isomerase protein